MNTITCPHCSTNDRILHNVIDETREEFINCNNCGYNKSTIWKRDDNGMLVTKDGTEEYTWENLISEVIELKNPYGAFRIKFTDNDGTQCGSIADENELNEIINNVRQEPNDVETFIVSRFVDGQIELEIIM